jgi:hypothetical protein
MNTAKIGRALRNHQSTSQHFIGVFPSDQLPGGLPFKPCALVINTDPADKPGQHWVAAYFDSNGAVDYFDSYGLEPTVRNIDQFLHTHSDFVFCNRHQVQGYLSSVCGQYCIFFLSRRCAGASMSDIVQHFSNNQPFVCDSYVCAWVNKRFGLLTEAFENDVVINQLCTAFGVEK